MSTYLLTWNPELFPWESLKEDIAKVREGAVVKARFSAGSTRKIRERDRLFLIRLGKPPNGIMASGFASSQVFDDERWGPKRSGDDRFELFVEMNFDHLLVADEKSVLDLDRKTTGPFTAMSWKPKISGTYLNDKLAKHLEKAWAEHIARIGPTA